MTAREPSNGRKWIVPLGLAVVGAGGLGGGTLLSTQVHRIDDRQTDARVRNTVGIALNATVLAEHGKMIARLDECMRHVQDDLNKLDQKIDRVLAAVE
jgi:hypothetical protein